MQGKVSPERSATRVYVGIDVCKTRLDVYIHPVGQRLTFSNDPDAIKKLKRWLKAHEVALVVMEATGKLHRAAHRSLHADGFAVAVVNPLRSRLFAQAVGALAKTDAVDARMLATLGESLAPVPTEPASDLVETLQELVAGRDGAVAARTALRNQLGATRGRVVAHEIQRQLRAVETAIANLDAEIGRLIASDPILARRLAVLSSIPGIGAVTASALIAGLAEIGSLSARQVAMIVGLAPIACDTGEHVGARHIRGGRAHVRRALYMAAVSAARCNPALKTFYDRLIAAGKKAKVALTAVMRKLAILANTLVREDRQWSPNHA
jgi:transposase